MARCDGDMVDEQKSRLSADIEGWKQAHISSGTHCTLRIREYDPSSQIRVVCCGLRLRRVLWKMTILVLSSGYTEVVAMGYDHI